MSEDQDKYVAMTYEQPEVIQAFAVLRRHLPASLRAQEAALEAAWFNGGPLPIDLPARLRKAADEAIERGWAVGLPLHLQVVAHELEEWADPDEVAAIERALLGQGGK